MTIPINLLVNHRNQSLKWAVVKLKLFNVSNPSGTLHSLNTGIIRLIAMSTFVRLTLMDSSWKVAILSTVQLVCLPFRIFSLLDKIPWMEKRSAGVPFTSLQPHLNHRFSNRTMLQKMVGASLWEWKEETIRTYHLPSLRSLATTVLSILADTCTYHPSASYLIYKWQRSRDSK